MSYFTRKAMCIFQKTWNEEDHPRAPAGSSEGGRFISLEGSSAPTAELADKSDLELEALRSNYTRAANEFNTLPNSNTESKAGATTKYGGSAKDRVMVSGEKDFISFHNPNRGGLLFPVRDPEDIERVKAHFIEALDAYKAQMLPLKQQYAEVRRKETEVFEEQERRIGEGMRGGTRHTLVSQHLPGDLYSSRFNGFNVEGPPKDTRKALAGIVSSLKAAGYEKVSGNQTSRGSFSHPKSHKTVNLNVLEGKEGNLNLRVRFTARG